MNFSLGKQSPCSRPQQQNKENTNANAIRETKTYT